MNESFFKVLNKEEWIEDGRWVQPPFVWSLFCHWSKQPVVKLITQDIKLGGIFTIDGYAFHEKISFDSIKKFLKEKYQHNELGDLADIITTEGEKLTLYIGDFLSRDDNYIKDNINDFLLHYNNFIGFWTVTTVLGNLLTQVVKEVGYVNSESDLFERVHPYLKISWIEQEALDVKNIAQELSAVYNLETTVSKNEIEDFVQKNNALKNLVDEYKKNYAWSKISKWKGGTITDDQVYERVLEELNNVLNNNYFESVKKEDIVNADGVVHLSVVCAYYRAWATMIEMKTALRLRFLFDRVAQVNAISYDDVLLLTPTEFSDVLKGDLVIPFKENVLNRKGSFMCMLSDTNEETIITSSEDMYKTVFDLYIKKDASEHIVKSLHGVAASKGNVVGIVRVVESAADFGDFKDDEILVTVETSPTFVPLMRKAAAIVTGRGGITSHAAIVSRELKKPCIISVKDVTKILKTGDKVEVNATAGIITIL